MVDITAKERKINGKEVMLIALQFCKRLKVDAKSIERVKFSATSGFAISTKFAYWINLHKSGHFNSTS